MQRTRCLFCEMSKCLNLCLVHCFIFCYGQIFEEEFIEVLEEATETPVSEGNEWDYDGDIGLYVQSTAKVSYGQEKLRKKEKTGLYVRSTAKVIYGREKLRKKEKPGPLRWHEKYPHCGGIHQSPVSIDTQIVVYDKNLSNLNLNGYDDVREVNMSIKNNGHTVQVDLKGKALTVSGGDLPGTYKAEQFHFHWGSYDKRGSEHDIDGFHFPMEMHIVHYLDQYPNYSEALDKDKGLLVLGFFFKVGPFNEHLQKIIQYFDQIEHKDSHVNLPTVALRSLMAKNLDAYYRYSGSLTTPPCYESVIWTVFREPIELSEKQLDYFRHKLKKNVVDTPDVDLSDDFRPVQQLHHRTIYGSKLATTLPYTGLPSGSPVLSCTNILIYVMSALLITLQAL